MTSRRAANRFTVCTTLIALTITHLPTAALAEVPIQELKAMQREADDYMTATNYAAALEIYTQLYGQTQHATYLWNVAYCKYELVKIGALKPEEAMQSLQQYLALPHVPSKKQAKRYLGEMDDLVKRQRETREREAAEAAKRQEEAAAAAKLQEEPPANVTATPTAAVPSTMPQTAAPTTASPRARAAAGDDQLSPNTGQSDRIRHYAHSAGVTREDVIASIAADYEARKIWIRSVGATSFEFRSASGPLLEKEFISRYRYATKDSTLDGFQRRRPSYGMLVGGLVLGAAAAGMIYLAATTEEDPGVEGSGGGAGIAAGFGAIAALFAIILIPMGLADQSTPEDHDILRVHATLAAAKYNGELLRHLVRQAGGRETSIPAGIAQESHAEEPDSRRQRGAQTSHRPSVGLGRAGLVISF